MRESAPYGNTNPRRLSAVTEALTGFGRETAKTFKILSRNKMGLFGFIMTFLIVVLSFAGPLFLPPEASANVEDINQGISARHWLGADFQGQDNLRKVINGGRDIVMIAFLTGILSTLIAVAVGSLSAFVGGKVDSVLMELVDVWLTVPRFPLLAVMATVTAAQQHRDAFGAHGGPVLARPRPPGAQPGALAEASRLH